MIDSIDIAENEELVFEIEKENKSFDFCYNNGAMYILCESDYFIVDDISSFVQKDNMFYLIDEEENSISFTREEYDILCDLINKCRNNEF